MGAAIPPSRCARPSPPLWRSADRHRTRDRNDRGDRTASLDLLGSLLLVCTMLALLYGLVDGSTYGWTTLPIACLGLAAVLFAGFAWRQATATVPVVKPSLLKNRGFTSGLLMGLLFLAAINGLM